MAPTDIFTITANPGTDIWRKPPTTDVFNAPTALPPAGPHPQRTSGPLNAFLSARLSLNFTPQEQYDQGGLLLSLRRKSGSDNNNNNAPPTKWIKTGIELYNGAPRVSTVGCDRWADWSVADLPPSSSSASGGETGWTTVVVEKDKDGNGTGLWVYRVAEGSGEKVPLREICWVFGEDPEAWEVEVHAMAARPEKEVQGGLTVEFAGLEVKWVS
jgi:regulation of enolase protein 1 (concanavalin A-like superfamily)